MTFPELRKKEGKIMGLVAVDHLFSDRMGSMLKKFLLIGVPFLIVAILSYEWLTFFPINLLYGLMLLDIAALILVFMFDAFYYAHYFKGMHTAIPEWGIPTENRVPYEVLDIVSRTSTADFTGGFLLSTAGKTILARLNISSEIVDLFYVSERNKLYADPITIDGTDLCSYAAAVFDNDKAFVHFLSEHGVGRNDFLNATSWVSDIYEKKKEMYRWWGRDALGRIRGIGKDWTKHEAEILERFCYFAEPKDEESVFKKEISTLERHIARSSQKKVLMIADEYRKLEAILSGLAERITDGATLPPLQHKKLLILNTVKLDDEVQAEGRFETILREIFTEATIADDIILVIKNFPFLIYAAKKRGLDLHTVLAPYLSSTVLSIIALSTREGHGELVKPDKNFTTHFDQYHVEADNKKIILRALQHKAIEIERKADIFFTYQSLATLADIADKTKGEHMAEHRALRLFIELAPKLVKKEVRTVTVSDVVALSH